MYNLISKFTGITTETLEKISLSALFSRPESHEFSVSQIKKLKNLATLISQYNEALVVQEKITIDSSTKATTLVESIFKSIMTVESFKAIWLDTQRQVIEVSTISTGTVNESVIHLRNIVKTGLEHNAVYVILCHNHPAGSLSPSSADITVTQKIKRAFEVIDIQVIDHIIATETGHYSFAEHGTL